MSEKNLLSPRLAKLQQALETGQEEALEAFGKPSKLRVRRSLNRLRLRTARSG